MAKGKKGKVYGLETDVQPVGDAFSVFATWQIRHFSLDDPDTWNAAPDQVQLQLLVDSEVLRSHTRTGIAGAANNRKVWTETAEKLDGEVQVRVRAVHDGKAQKWQTADVEMP